jgi:hypothetical protein
LEAVIYSDEQLKAKCAEWQKILRLEDWTIFIEIHRARDLKTENSQAEIEPFLLKRMAKIRILAPIDYEPTCWTPQDMEVSLVHELLHIHLFQLFADRENESRQIAEEQAIEAISRALVGLYRRGGETKNEKDSDLR